MKIDLATKAAAVGCTLIVAHLCYTYLVSPLQKFPGPFLAKFTDLWRFWDHYSCTQVQSHQNLHAKHGPAVRIGPNMVILSDPSLIKTVYSTRGEYLKSDFYELADTIDKGRRVDHLFSTRSNARHAMLTKPIAKFFDLAEVLKKEPLLDKTIVLLCEQLEKRFIDGQNAGKVADLADWIVYGAWEFDLVVTFSQDMGFLKTGSDVDGIISQVTNSTRYLGLVGQMPWLDRLLGKNPWCPFEFSTFDSVGLYCQKRIAERLSTSGARPQMDYLDNYLAVKEENPQTIDDNAVMSYLFINVMAGADTTALVQKIILYPILKNPTVHKKLQEELDAARLSFPPQYEDTKDLPYLNACIKEGQRMHPLLAVVNERVVPPEGLRLADGRFVPRGTKVGINPWVTSRNKEIYGRDADVFRPERWLRDQHERENDYASRLKLMKDCDLTFSAGRRGCSGVHLATVELHKLTATLFSRYNMALDADSKQWTPRWWWFGFVDDINVRMQRR